MTMMMTTTATTIATTTSRARSRSLWLPAAAAAVLCAAGANAQSLVDDLAWAYAITPGTDPAATVDDGTQRSLPGTDKTFKLDQIRNRQGPADWFPGDHPAMPSVVANGREAAGIWACSLCHYPNGKGRPENAGVSGLPKEYFIQQLHDMKHGLRMSADTRKPNTSRMIAFAAAMTDEEIQQAAEYFGAMKWTPWIDVVEAKTVPKTLPRGGMHLQARRRRGRHGAARQTHHRDAAQHGVHRGAAQSALGLHRVRAGGRRGERQNAGHHGRRQDDAVHRMSRREP